MLDIGLLQSEIRALQDGDEDLRKNALQSLRQHDQQAWATVPHAVKSSLVTTLQGLLFDKSNRHGSQKDMVSILGKLGPSTKAVLPQLLELLRDGVPEAVREAAVAALGGMGKDASPAVKQLVHMMATSRPALSVQIIRALGNIGCADEEVRSVLVSRWFAPPQDQSGKEQVAIALCKLHIAAENLHRTLTAALTVSQHAYVRKAAAEALTWCAPKDMDVVPALLKASLSDTNEEVRQTAQAGLDHMGLSREEAIDLCAGQLGTSVHAEAALRKTGQPAVPALVKTLGNSDAAIRVKALRTLDSLGEVAVDAIPAITETVHDKDMDVRLAALKALWSVSKSADRVVPGLVKLLDARTVAKLEDSETRRRFLQTVMEAIRRIEPPPVAAVPALTAMAKDSNRHVRESAVITLQKIAPAAEGKSASRR